MKKILMICAATALLLLVGCSSYEPVVFPFGKTYTYEVSFADGCAVPDTSFEIKMTTSKNKFFGQFGLKYEYFTHDGTPVYVEKTGYTEDKGCVELHPPRMGMMAFTEVVPFPTYWFPVGCYVSSNGSIKVANSTFTAANGKTIEYAYKQGDVDTLNHWGEEIECFVVIGENTNHYDDIGHYRVTYWFHPQYGFVLWKYELPEGKCVWLKLQK